MPSKKGKSKNHGKHNTTKQPQPQPQPQQQQQQQIPAPVVAVCVPSIDELFVSLDRHIKANDFREIIKVADQILAVAPGDTDALVCKVVTLIQSDDIDGAIAVIDASPSAQQLFCYHKAYCLYRKNQLHEALMAMHGLERSDEVLQLEAQILYRLGDFNACIASYGNLFQKHIIDSNELKTNLIASYISGGRSNEVSVLMESLKVRPNGAFELAYNAGCAHIEKGDFSKAEELLLLARRIGEEMLIEEEYTSEEIENELAPISVQLAYVQQVQGRTVEALDNYNQLLKKIIADQPSMAVASNNLIALRGNRELNDSVKKIERLFENRKFSEQGGISFIENLEQKLSLRQKEIIAYNRFLVLLLSSKLEQAREFLPVLSEKFPDSIMPAVLNASLLAREGKLTRAEDLLGHLLEKHPDDISLCLFRAQIAAQAGHHVTAVKSLEQISQLQHKPAMVATLVALKEKSGDVRGAEATLDAAVHWWDGHMGEDFDALEVITREAAAFKLTHKNLDGALTLFSRLVKSSTQEMRVEALTGLVSSMVHTDLTKAEEYERQLPALPGMAGIDVSSLEKMASIDTPMLGGKRPWNLESGEELSKNKNRTRHKKRPRYPKGFDPANPGPPPDPERWLPKRERSTYRPKRKDKRGIQLRGAQGAVSRGGTSTGTSSTGVTSLGLSKTAAANGKGGPSSGLNVDSSKGQASNVSKSNKPKKKSRR